MNDNAGLAHTGGAGLPADRNPIHVYLAGLGSEHSRDAARQAARKCLGLLLDRELTDDEVYAFPFRSLRYQHLVYVRQRLAVLGYAPASINQWLAMLKGILRECWRLGLTNADAHARIADVQGVKATRLPAGRALSAGELRELFAACADSTPGGVRDCALLATMYGTGVRRGEVVWLQVSDHDPDAGTLTINGKGGKQRLAHLPAGAQQALAAWLHVRGHEPGPVFLPVDRAGRIGERALSTQAVAEALGRRARRAGIPRFTPHDLRRTFVGDLLDAGADVAQVQGLAGHANVDTTMRYDRRGEHAKRRAADMLAVPVSGSE